MRALILTATAVLFVTGCRNNDQANTAQNIDDSLTADSIVANDVTAIDAVTGDAANMAADVDINFTNDVSEPGTNASAPTAAKARPASKPKPSASPDPGTPTQQPAENTSGNATE